MPSLRHKRKSQTGTPQDTPAGTPPSMTDSRKEKAQTSLDSWIEPQPQNLAPSFEEHSFARHGVLETMAPLGTPPTSRTKAKARSEHPDVRKSRLGKSFTVEGEGTTPETTQPAKPDLSKMTKQEQGEFMKNLIRELQELDTDTNMVMYDEEMDDSDAYDDWLWATLNLDEAQPSPGAKTPVRGKSTAKGKGTAKGKSAAQGKSHAQSRTPVQKGTPQPPASISNTPGVHNGGYASWADMDISTQQRIRIAVNDAISRFNKGNKRNVGMALKEMLDDCPKNDKLARSLNGIIHQKETAEDWTVFRQYLKNAKKQIKRTMKEQRAQEALKSAKAARTRSSSLPPVVNSPRQNPPSPLDAETAAAPTIETVECNDSVPEDVATSSTPLADAESAEVAPNPLTTAPAFPAADAPTPPARKMNSKSPRKQQALNSHLAPRNDRDTTEASTHAPTPIDGDGSDSALSDVDDDLIKNVEAPAPAPVRISTPSVASRKTKSAINAANAAHARAVKKARQSSAKPLGKYSKAQPLTEMQKAERAEIEKIRQKYNDDQQALREVMQGFAPTSDIRFDDEILETESLTESQIAVGPPVADNMPRRAGRHPRHDARNGLPIKRPREDGSRFSSPHPDSAATSRPSTPAATFSHVPSKRVKLNNGHAHQVARTKKSPVKNRDGPVAGIPHTGGGGSRQSGPDDNGPSSPPSETDDLCSACKGAGEFVICDHCPRVFHFLCCDPPMLEAPTGHFSCFECSAKLKPTEESAESYTPLGPLFKALESTNTRAFTLPADVQTHFEGVSARPDGSYFEETKKFPLSKSSGYGYQRPDYTKVSEGDKPILCASCGLTSANKRQMLKCDFCASHWHLDCLDPPLANPPHINLDSAHRDAWRCPRHIEHDLRSGYVAQNDLNEAQETTVTDASLRLGRKVRKPRHPQIVQPTFSRGLRNNGLIEIINDPDDDTDGEGNYVYGNEEKDFNSHVYRVPEKGLVLDFIDKVKSGHIVKRVKQAEAFHKSAAQRKDSMAHFAVRPIQEQQAALNLTRLAKKEQEIGLNEVSVDALVLSLTAEAPNEVTTAISDAAPPPVSESERAQLLKLQKLINMRLAASQS